MYITCFAWSISKDDGHDVDNETNLEIYNSVLYLNAPASTYMHYTYRRLWNLCNR